MRKLGTFGFCHSQSRKTLLEVAQKYEDTKISIIQSEFSNTGRDMDFEEKELKTNEELIVFLKNNQCSEEEIIKVINKE